MIGFIFLAPSEVSFRFDKWYFTRCNSLVVDAPGKKENRS
jgi:hypothetical protein